MALFLISPSIIYTNRFATNIIAAVVESMNSVVAVVAEETCDGCALP